MAAAVIFLALQVAGAVVGGRQASGTYGRYCRHCGTACLATALP